VYTQHLDGLHHLGSEVKGQVRSLAVHG
jgi:hypothetical protein